MITTHFLAADTSAPPKEYAAILITGNSKQELLDGLHYARELYSANYIKTDQFHLLTTDPAAQADLKNHFAQHKWQDKVTLVASTLPDFLQTRAHIAQTVKDSNLSYYIVAYLLSKANHYLIIASKAAYQQQKAAAELFHQSKRPIPKPEMVVADNESLTPTGLFKFLLDLLCKPSDKVQEANVTTDNTSAIAIQKRKSCWRPSNTIATYGTLAAGLLFLNPASRSILPTMLEQVMKGFRK